MEGEISRELERIREENSEDIRDFVESNLAHHHFREVYNERNLSRMLIKKHDLQLSRASLTHRC